MEMAHGVMVEVVHGVMVLLAHEWMGGMAHGVMVEVAQGVMVEVAYAWMVEAAHGVMMEVAHGWMVEVVDEKVAYAWMVEAAHGVMMEVALGWMVEVVDEKVLIMLSGNYGFFNLLTIVLAMLHFDDDVWAWVARRRGGAAPLAETTSSSPPPPGSGQALAASHRSTGGPCVNHDEVYASVADRKAAAAARAKQAEEAMVATPAAAGAEGWPMRMRALLRLAERAGSLLLITAAGWGFVKMFRFGHSDGLERIELAFTVRELDDFLGTFLPLAIQLFG
eukprot:gene28303-35061_t